MESRFLQQEDSRGRKEEDWRLFNDLLSCQWPVNCKGTLCAEYMVNSKHEKGVALQVPAFNC